MNRYRRFCLSLCFLLACCVGFLLTDNTSYAYEQQDNFYPIVYKDSRLRIVTNNDYSTFTYYPATVQNNKYYFSNPYTENITAISWHLTNTVDDVFYFPYNPELYDYYLLGTLTAKNSNATPNKSTFKPTGMEIYGFDYATQTFELYPLSGLGYYDLDNEYWAGFGFYTKVLFPQRDNIGFQSIAFTNDKDGLGNKPANLILDMGILAVEKSSSESAALTSILNQLKEMEQNIAENIQNGSNAISSAIGESAEKIEGAINDQYEIEENEDFGVGTITEQVEEKLGVLTVGTGTLIGFLDLFNSSNAGSTEIVFPAFEITVQGETYPVWNDISYDLSTLENDFGILINAVRTILVLCVWMAVLSYLVKAKDHVINNRG